MGESISPYDIRDAMIKVFPECVIEMKDQEKTPSGSAKGFLLKPPLGF